VRFFGVIAIPPCPNFFPSPRISQSLPTLTHTIKTLKGQTSQHPSPILFHPQHSLLPLIMAYPVWPSNLTDFTAIGATPDLSPSFPHVARTNYRGAYVAGISLDASSGMSLQSEIESGGARRKTRHAGEPGWTDPGASYVAPERPGGLGVRIPSVDGTPVTSSQETVQGHKRNLSNGFMESQHSQSSFTARSPSAMSDTGAYSASSSSSNRSGSPYPSPAPQAYTALSQSHNNYIAEPLIPTHSSKPSIYTDYFSNVATESLCLFNDIEAQFYPTPVSPASSSSPGPNFVSSNSTTAAPNYSGPIRNHIVNMTTDSNGVVWIVFPYSKNKEVKNHTIRCDVDKVPPSALRPDIKTVAAAVLPLQPPPQPVPSEPLPPTFSDQS